MPRIGAAAPARDEWDEVVAWYRERIEAPAEEYPWKGLPYEPLVIGPTWKRDGRRWLLPERTIGYDALAFAGLYLEHEGEPWRYTMEQARFMLWWYSVDETGRFLFRDGVLQRLKGWGKDPVGGTLMAHELLGPCRFDGFERRAGLAAIAATRDEPNAWVQVAATALDQTKTTMRLFPGLFAERTRRLFDLQIGKEVVHAMGDSRFLQAVTSSPATLEGARATFVLENETHHWLATNDGHGMADVIERNATKSPAGAARTLAITNAYEPGEDSVAQNTREAYEKALADGRPVEGLLYDSLEAPPEAPLSAEAAPDVIAAVRGDSTWIDVARVVESIMDPRNAPSRSRRWWYNQVTAAEDAWVAPAEWDACARAVDPAAFEATGPRVGQRVW